jgi:hypothetical protein
MKKERFNIYFWNGEEWLFTFSFEIIGDKVHWSSLRELEKIQEHGFEFKIEYVEYIENK